MKVAATLLLLSLFLILTAPLAAQPVVSYTMPDIVAPGMNIYLEIIGPAETPGNFGGDGFYANNSTDAVRVELDNPADAATVAIGPLVVSWEGKMISTQIFVKPTRTVPTPTTIRLKVTANGQSTVTSIGLDNPQRLGTNGVVSAGGGTVYLGSSPGMGTRSARGVMIVEELYLTNGTFTASTNNLFPLTIIAKGPIQIRSGATLQVNGSTTAGQTMNAGAGGGGGGGRPCDAIAGSPPTTPGGSGFTGGSGGPRNTTSKIRQPAGQSTGTAGFSANGARGGRSDEGCHEGAMGGTGHPFGRGGQSQWCANGFPDSPGDYGGAVVYLQRSGGGGGGYRTNGGNGGLSTANGGQTHGNIFGVPVAGGSGGSSGNPQASLGNGCAGAGGGGGGALVLYSMAGFQNQTGGLLQAIGANGENDGTGGFGSGNASGGGGSGGSIIIGGKHASSTGGTGSVAGGNGGTTANRGGNGGSGLVRGDGLISGDPSMTGAPTPFLGPTIDSLTYRDSATFTLTGTIGTLNGTPYPITDFQIYMKSDAAGAVWTSLGPPTRRAGRFWALPVTVTTSATYYFVIVQDVSGNPQGDGYNRRPDRVMSQAGANIIRVDLIPKMNTLPDNLARLTFGPVSCTDVDYDTVRIYNTGDAPLVVTPTITGANAGDFQLVNPAQRTIAPGDTILMAIRFAPTATGARTATLNLPNNDPRAGKSPYTFTLTGQKLVITPTLSGTNPVDFGPICKGATVANKTITLNYTGDQPSTLVRIEPIGADATSGIFGIVSPTPPQTLTVGSATPITIRFQPGTPAAVRAYTGSFRVIVGACDTLVIQVRGSVVEVAATVTPNPLQFGNARVNVPVTLPFTVTNTGASPIKVKSVTITPAGPFVVATPNLNGTTIAPGATATGNVTFTPTASGDFSAQLCVEIEDAVNALCASSVCVNMTGKGVTSLLVLSDKTLLFEADTCADPAGPVTKTFTLFNRGAVAERVTGVTTANARVTVTSVPALPVDLDVDEGITFTVTWTPGLAGLPLTEQVIITTTSPEPTQQRMTVDLTLVRERSLLNLLDAAGAPIASDSLVTFPYVFDCNVPQTREIVIRNAGTITTGYTARLLGGAPFSFSPAAGTALAAGADQRITVTFAPGVAGEYEDTLEIVSLQCGVVMRIALKGGRYDLNYTVTGAAFGSSNVGVTRTGTVSIAFDSTTPNDVRARIVSVTTGAGTGPEFTVTAPTLPVDLAPKEALTVPVSFTPTAEQAYSGTVCFQLSEPCDTTICVDLSGTGIRSNILVRQSSLDFGTLYICKTSEIQFLIENTGSAPLTLQNLQIGGPDAGAFEILEPLPADLPTDIPGPGSRQVRVRFVPALAGSDGLKTATLSIISNDATQGNISVGLVGERRQQVLATPVELDFGRVEVGQTVEKTVTLENRSTDPLTISQLALPAPFVIIDPIIPPDRVIPAGGTVTVRVSFTPVDTILVEQTMLASQSAPCTGVTSVPVRGQGKITEQGAVTVSLPDSLRGRPGETLAIPFVLERSRVLAETGATTFRARVRFNNVMLFPTGARSGDGASFKPVTGMAASGGRIISSVVEGNDRVVTVEITNDPMPTAPDTLGFLDVTVALGNALTTPVEIDTLFFTDGDAPVAVTTDDGLFTLEGYCTIGGDRLVEITGSAKIRSATPNPVGSSTEIVFETAESGPTSVAVFDASGSRIETLVDNESLPVQAHLVVWNAGRLPSGVYYIVMQTPTERSSMRVVVVK